jgi:glycosyltransferase involved in cell wall biosynthesis
MTKFSVVIPLYNKEHFVKKTIQSVLDQTDQEFEIIIVDDGSTDNSLQKAKEFSDDRLSIHQQDNKGASSARNKGVSLSKHNWIAFLDADDIWYKNHLEELSLTIKNVPDAQVVSNGYEIRLDKYFIKKPKFSQPLSEKIIVIDDYFSYSYIDPLFWTSSIAVDKKCFLDIGGFDADISSGQDTDLMCRLAINFVLAYNPKVTFLHIKTTENNLSKSNYIDARLKIIQKLKGQEKSNHSLKKYLDVNRFSLAMQAKVQRRMNVFKDLHENIDVKNLNQKQLLLLKCPAWVLKKLKNIQKALIKIGIYKSAFN